ncbi:serine/threonine-protein kinase [Streptomyces sp. NPDC003697]
MEELKSVDPRQVGRYRISALLGAGGMGRVFLGRSPSGRLVAVKVVRPELAEDPGFRRRFAQEVAAARKVTGFFTAALVDADPEGSPPWLATAYVPGMALDQAVAAHGPWPVTSVRALGAGLAEALEAIHAAGLVHRDLKPSNVLIAPDGPRVVDFGISVAAEATALTRAGTIVGTPGFMAPEQLTGKPVTPATDVFALGAVLTYAATGTGPFGTGSAQSLNFRIAYEEPQLGRLPGPGLEILIDCLEKDPLDRPTVGELIEELAEGVGVDGYTPTEIVTEPASWLPGQVARALPATATAPAAPVSRTPEPEAAPPAAPPAPPVRPGSRTTPSGRSGPRTAPSVSTHPKAATADAATTAQARTARPRPDATAQAARPVTAAKSAAARSATAAKSGTARKTTASRANTRRPARPAQPPVVTAQPSSFRRALPFWVAGAALVLALFQPFAGWPLWATLLLEDWTYSYIWVFHSFWPLALVALFGVGSCAAVLSSLRRSPSGPVPPWTRCLHIVSTVLATGLFLWVGVVISSRQGVVGLDSGGWFFLLGCAALIWSTFRLRVPKNVSTP